MQILYFDFSQEKSRSPENGKGFFLKKMVCLSDGHNLKNKLIVQIWNYVKRSGKEDCSQNWLTKIDYRINDSIIFEFLKFAQNRANDFLLNLVYLSRINGTATLFGKLYCLIFVTIKYDSNIRNFYHTFTNSSCCLQVYVLRSCGRVAS